jgi:hypothetical protein
MAKDWPTATFDCDIAIAAKFKFAPLNSKSGTMMRPRSSSRALPQEHEERECNQLEPMTQGAALPTSS